MEYGNDINVTEKDKKKYIFKLYMDSIIFLLYNSYILYYNSNVVELYN